MLVCVSFGNLQCRKFPRVTTYNVLSFADCNTNTSADCHHEQRKRLNGPMEPDLFEYPQEQISGGEDDQKGSDHQEGMEGNTAAAVRAATRAKDIDTVRRRIDHWNTGVTCSGLEIEIEGIVVGVLTDGSIQGVALDLTRAADSPNHVLVVA